MGFLQFDPPPTDKLSLRFMEFHNVRAGFHSDNAHSIRRRSEPLTHDDVMAHFRSRRRNLYSAVSRGHCTWQGVTP